MKLLLPLLFTLLFHACGRRPEPPQEDVSPPHFGRLQQADAIMRFVYSSKLVHKIATTAYRLAKDVRSTRMQQELNAEEDALLHAALQLAARHAVYEVRTLHQKFLIDAFNGREMQKLYDSFQTALLRRFIEQHLHTEEEGITLAGFFKRARALTTAPGPNSHCSFEQETFLQFWGYPKDCDASPALAYLRTISTQFTAEEQMQLATLLNTDVLQKFSGQWRGVGSKTWTRHFRD